MKLGSGKFLHINFISTSRGSYLTTDNEKVQQALENHPRFGKLFSLDSKETIIEKAKETPKKDVQMEKEKISFSDPGEAVDYLADKYGVSRTKLKSINAIKSVAESLGLDIEIEGM